MDATFEISGLAELERALEQFPAKLEANILRGALRAGAREIQAIAKAEVPVLTGTLRDSIKVSTGRDKRRGGLYARVSAGSRVAGGGRRGAKGAARGAFYAHMVEFGTGGHYINARQGGTLSLRGVFRKRVLHPGATKRPFMRVARDRGAPRALAAMADYLRTRIPKEAAKR